MPRSINALFRKKTLIKIIQINQMVNKAQGKGYEDERNYTNMRLVTFDIDNIHVMRQSQQKLLEGILKSQLTFSSEPISAVTKTTSITDYIKTLDSSGWLKHVRSIIECGIFIADALIKGVLAFYRYFKICIKIGLLQRSA